ncbi:MAG: DUF3667 domain-containing protein [Lutibacter sp.]
MKLKIIKFKSKEIKGLECLNCGQPLLNNENFCSNCGQKNSVKKLSFSNFLSNLFSGFFSYDSRFWKTFIPLLTKPGKISKQYIEGKRIRFVNPFQLYLNVSIIFFLIFGLTNKLDQNQSANIANLKLNKQEIDTIIRSNKHVLDSVLTKAKSEIKKKSSNDTTATKVVTGLEDVLKVLDNNKVKTKPSVTNLNFDTLASKNSFINKMKIFNNFHDKNPNIKADIALDRLGFKKSFWNTFYYQQIINFNYNFQQIKTQGKSYFINKITSYISIALFIFLPLFTLFLKLIFIRRKYTYMEHLVFVFHTQTVFFLLYIIFYSINYLAKTDTFTAVFILIFSIYLYKAMRNFYQQSRLKTFMKFVILNGFYLTLAGFGLLIVAILSFMIK